MLHAELVSTGSTAGCVDRQTGHHHSARETQDLWAGLRFPPHPQQQVSGCLTSLSLSSGSRHTAVDLCCPQSLVVLLSTFFWSLVSLHTAVDFFVISLFLYCCQPFFWSSVSHHTAVDFLLLLSVSHHIAVAQTFQENINMPIDGCEVEMHVQ